MRKVLPVLTLLIASSIPRCMDRLNEMLIPFRSGVVMFLVVDRSFPVGRRNPDFSSGGRHERGLVAVRLRDGSLLSDPGCRLAGIGRVDRHEYGLLIPALSFMRSLLPSMVTVSQ
jgi:hypothetical protein